MKIAGKAYIFPAVIVVILGVLLVAKDRSKSIPVPYDDKHARFFDAANRGGERKEVEKECARCHGAQNIPLSQKHPPKEQCLICHKLSRIKK